MPTDNGKWPGTTRRIPVAASLLFLAALAFVFFSGLTGFARCDQNSYYEQSFCSGSLSDWLLLLALAMILIAGITATVRRSWLLLWLGFLGIIVAFSAYWAWMASTSYE